MKLYLNTSSPFARYVRVVALQLEQGLEQALELAWCDPWGNDPELIALNPLCRIPTLVTDQGIGLSESGLIVQYLLQQKPEHELAKSAYDPEVLQLCGLAHGLMELSFNTVINDKHAGKEQRASYLGERRVAGIKRMLEQLEQGQPDRPDGNLNLADLALVVALQYLMFRLPELIQVPQYPQLHNWLMAISEHKVFKETAFH
jgi:glutathione S-transferase